LLGLGSRTDFKVDIRGGDAKLLKKTAGHGVVVVLTGVDEAVAELPAFRFCEI